MLIYDLKKNKHYIWWHARAYIYQTPVKPYFKGIS